MRQSLYLIFGRNFPRKWSLQDRSAFGALSATLEDLAKRHGVPLEKKQPLDLLKALLRLWLWGGSSVYLTCYSCVYLMHGLHLSEDLSLSTIDMMYVCSSLSILPHITVPSRSACSSNRFAIAALPGGTSTAAARRQVGRRELQL